jgi:dynein heavy chain
LKPDEIEADFKKMQRASVKLINLFESKNQSKPKQVAAIVQKELEIFKPSLPVIRALCNSGLQDRHKKLIAEVIGKSDIFDPSSESISSLETMKILEYTE